MLFLALAGGNGGHAEHNEAVRAPSRCACAWIVSRQLENIGWSKLTSLRSIVLQTRRLMPFLVAVAAPAVWERWMARPGWKQMSQRTGETNSAATASCLSERLIRHCSEDIEKPRALLGPEAPLCSDAITSLANHDRD